MKTEYEPVWKYLDVFRKSWYFQQVLDEGYIAKWGGYFIQGILDDSDEEFIEGLGEFLINQTMIQSRTVQPFLKKNSVKEIRDAFTLFSEEEIEPVEFVDKFLELDQCGIFIASHLLSFASEGAYIIYHEKLYEALIELFPILEESIDPVTDGVSYMLFQMACDVIMRTYHFTSCQELHEFLWHGKDTDWKFTKKEE